MLSQLVIKNIAVIETASVNFDNGFYVLTGETGAGKSILIDSINAVLGKRTNKDIIRNGCETGTVTAVFTDLPYNIDELASQYGVDLSDDILSITRDLNINGKTTSRINGVIVPQTFVRKIAEMLIDIHGQSDNMLLLDPSYHLRYIDLFAENKNLLNDYKDVYNKYCEINLKIEKISANDKANADRVEYLKYVLNELETANLSVEEENELLIQKNIVKNNKYINDNLQQADGALSGDVGFEGACDLVKQSYKNISDIVEYIPKLEPVSKRLENIIYELVDCKDEINGYFSENNYTEADIDRIESRLYTYYTLTNKYKRTTENLGEYQKEIKDELDSIDFSEEQLSKFNEIKDELKNQLGTLSNELNKKRMVAAAKLAEAVRNELEFMNMPGVIFEVRFEETEFTKTGCDKCEFYISVNAGEPPKPICKIASGGELSRIMLGIKNALTESDDQNKTMIFDEIDTGVSGKAASKIGMKLKQVSKNKQLLCVTHLPQIAAYADNQLLIEKRYDDYATYTTVTPLDKTGRINEIARMISGNDTTELALSAAEELLDLSAK